MMKKLTALIGGVGCLALQACSGGGLGDESLASDESIGTEEAAINASIEVFQSGPGWYCAFVHVANNLTVPANDWTMVLDMKGTTINPGDGTNGRALWGAYASATSGSAVTMVPQSYMASIAPQSTMYYTFCASAPNVQYPPRAVVKDYNASPTQYDVCSTNSGLHPTRAALAVAMANEMGRWQPQTDLVKGWNGKVEVSSTGMTRCTNGCANTKAILAQQDTNISNVVPQSLFNPTVFMEDMKASFDRQKNKLDDLTRNNPGQLPPAHKLTKIGGPVSLGLGACGPHYVYSVTDMNNVKLSSTAAAAVANALCFYGQGSCGANPYIGFVSSSVPGCPADKTCIAIDPLDGDNTSGSTTSAGSAPTYPMNRTIYDYNLVNSSCITKAGLYGKMKCLSTGCNGFLYCTP